MTLMTQTEQDEREIHPFEFRGKTPEYFKIWLVNVLLSVITLGLYSPWATVRTRRYFYGTTVLGGANFEYHADPRSILVARLVLVALIVGGSFIAGEDAVRSAVHSLLLFLLLPWAMVRGFAFNARNSSYRGIRFGFARRYLRLYLIFLPATALIIAFNYYLAALLLTPDSELDSVYPWVTAPVLIALAVVWVSAPFTSRAYHRFKAEHHRLGGVEWAFRPARRRGYMCALWLVPLAAAAAAAGIGWIFLSTGWLQAMLGWYDAIAAYILLLLLALVTAWLLLTSMLFKLYWRGVTAQRGRILCDISVWRFALQIRLVNLLAALLTLGLAIPWARIRRASYLAAHFAVETEPQAMEFLFADAARAGSAFGDEFAASEGFDFDVGLM